MGEAETGCQHIATSVGEGQLLEGGQTAPESPGLSPGDPGGQSGVSSDN